MSTPAATQRLGLLLDPGQSIAAQLDCEALSAWHFTSVRTPPQAWDYLTRMHPHVGLIAFQHDQPPREEIAALVHQPGTEWVALVPQDGHTQHALGDLIRSAFFDHHTLPIDATRLAFTLGHAFGRATLHPAQEVNQDGRFGMTGNSPPMRALYHDIERIAAADAAVLISGESGTGKELVARAISRHSRRANGPFLAINCGALARGLIQSELFGFEKGAFTGATHRTIGRIEAAHHGVLLLDEIGDLPLEQQASLLRFLQEKTITRIGSNQAIAVDVRILAATHVDLAQAVSRHQFREDLYYRLNVLTLVVPPLRARGQDIAPLAQRLLADILDKHPGKVRILGRDALAALQRHPWPGNVRELINRLRRAVVMSERRLITPADLGLPAPHPPWPHKLADAREDTEKTTIEEALAQNAHNITHAARQLGVSRVTLYRMMSRHNIASSRRRCVTPGRGNAC